MPAAAGKRLRVRRDDIIRIRASAETKALLNQAAALKGQKLPEFILDRARKEAESVILDQRTFFLDPETHEEFIRLLDASAKPSAKLRERMNRKPLWER
jgi:uncharacterized protein (DUF1778 family)